MQLGETVFGKSAFRAPHSNPFPLAGLLMSQERTPSAMTTQALRSPDRG